MNARGFSLSVLAAIALAAAPLGAQAAQAGQQGGGVTCADGTKSTATGRGACSGHGGVAKQAAAAAKVAEKKETKTAAKLENRARGAIAKCKDGTYSHAKSLQGACSSHGGVEHAMKKG
jgi:hypothetical protein